jgi:hypothetical protein
MLLCHTVYVFAVIQSEQGHIQFISMATLIYFAISKSSEKALCQLRREPVVTRLNRGMSCKDALFTHQLENLIIVIFRIVLLHLLYQFQSD